MASQDDTKFCEIFDRLRETEAQTREQNERIANLCERLDNFSTVTDRFFDMTEKMHQEESRRFQVLCDHEKRLSEKNEEREERMWKVIVVLVGTVLAAAFGPKMATELYTTWSGKKIPVSSFQTPIMAMPTNDMYAFSGCKSFIKV